METVTTQEGRILAIDPGTHCGWATREANGDFYRSGTWDLSPGRFSGAGMRFLRFEKLLDELYVACGSLSAVYFEDVRGHKGTYAAQIYGGFVAVLTAWCERKNIPYQGIPVADVKRAATGKGGGKGADKQAMVNAAMLKWPDQQIKDDNQADALWILKAAELL